MAARSHEGLETLYRKTDKHEFESTTNRSSSTSQQYYTARKPGGITKEAMRVSLARRYPPPPASSNARGEARHDGMKRPTGVGPRNTVRSFTQPFTLSAQTSHYERTPRYPSRTSTNPSAGQQVSHQTSPLGVSLHPEYNTPCYSSTTGRKSSTTACISPKLEPRYESGYYSPPSMTEPCQNRAVYVHDCRDTQTKGNARKPVTDTEKPLPPLQPERIDHRFFEHRYRDGKASYSEAKEWSSDASDEQYGRYQQKPESLSSHNNLLRPAMFADAPTSPSVSSTKTAREQRRSLPKSDVRGDSDKEYLDVDEVEEEITCPICMSVLVGTTAASPCGHIFCGGCGLEWIRANETCPICRKQLTTPASLSLVPVHVMDALVQKWVKGKGSRWEGLKDWEDRCEVWETQRVVWREDLAAIESERKHQMEERGRGQQNQGSHEQSFSHIDGPQPALGDFLLTDLLSLGVHGGAPVTASSAQLREYIRPDPISSFLDEVSRLRREIRTERDHYLSTTLQASSHSPSISSSWIPHAADPRSFGHEPGWEVYSPYSWNAASSNRTMHPQFGLAAGDNAGLASSIEDLGSRIRDLWTGVSRS